MTADPLNVALTDTISGLWRGFPSLLVKEARIYSRLDGLRGVVLARLTDRPPFAVRLDDAFGRPWIVLATPIGITEANISLVSSSWTQRTTL